MTTNQASVLSILLALNNLVIANDASDQAIQTNISALNAITDTDKTFDDMISENVSHMIDSTLSENAAVITLIIDGLTCLTPNKLLFSSLLTMRNLTDPQKMADFIDTSLNSNIDNFGYYSMLSQLAIQLGDTKRIEAVLTKIKSLSGV